MKKLLLVFVCVFALAFISVAIANTASEGEGYNITASPKCLKLTSRVDVLTVHSDIPITLVDRDSVEMNGLVPYSVGADSLGAMVAKFDIEQFKETLAKGSLTLTLSVLVDGELVEASDTIVVK